MSDLFSKCSPIHDSERAYEAGEFGIHWNDDTFMFEVCRKYGMVTAMWWTEHEFGYIDIKYYREGT